MAKVSIILPARNEPFLKPTVEDVLRQATGDVEVIAVMDGSWSDPPLPDDPRIKILHWGTAQGLRPSINAGMALATGDYLMKLDAHCAVSKGFDEVLAAACEDNELVVPEKYSLAPETWEMFKQPWHYFYLTWPWEQNGRTWGMHEVNYGPEKNAERAHLPIDDILTFQGSAWMIRRSHWERMGEMDTNHYYFAHEAPELGMKTWLGGGRCKIVKTASYGHLHKGHAHKRTFIRHKQKWNAAIAWSTKYWMGNQWSQRVHDFDWVIDKFGPLPGWPENWKDEAEKGLRDIS